MQNVFKIAYWIKGVMMKGVPVTINYMVVAGALVIY
jgi:hypothetical protein